MEIKKKFEFHVGLPQTGIRGGGSGASDTDRSAGGLDAGGDRERRSGEEGEEGGNDRGDGSVHDERAPAVCRDSLVSLISEIA